MAVIYLGMISKARSNTSPVIASPTARNFYSCLQIHSCFLRLRSLYCPMCLQVLESLCMYVRMYVFMNVCMYLQMYVSMCLIYLLLSMLHHPELILHILI